MDHSFTKVLLIGASEFPLDETVFPIPGVNSNLFMLKACLTNTEIVGIPESNITISLNESKAEIEEKLNDLVNETKNKKFTIIVYYSGHGMLNIDDRDLYLTTSKINERHRWVRSIKSEHFKNQLKKSFAGRKIVILDCCFSGRLIDVMALTEAKFKNFEGSYFLTSTPAREYALFDHDSPERPTYFTEKLIEVIQSGIDNNEEFCSLRDIFYEIESDFTRRELPIPQQQNINGAGDLFFSKNPKFLNNKNQEYIEWKIALKKNSRVGFLNFIKKFPNSELIVNAQTKITEIEENELWRKASGLENLLLYDEYLRLYPKGQHAKQALIKSNELFTAEKISKEEERIWRTVLEQKKSSIIKEYLISYPNGIYNSEAKILLAKQLDIEAWENAKNVDEIKVYEEYLNNFENGTYISDAKKAISILSYIGKIELPKIEKKQLSLDEKLYWENATRQNKRELYLQYLEKYPDGIYAKVAAVLLGRSDEEETWQYAIRSNSILGYQNYIRNFSTGIHNKEAISAIAKLSSSNLAKTQIDEQKANNKYSLFRKISTLTFIALFFLSKMYQLYSDHNDTAILIFTIFFIVGILGITLYFLLKKKKH